MILNKQFRFNGDRLTLEGIIAGRISETSGVFAGLDATRLDRMPLASWIIDCLKLVHGSAVFDINPKDSFKRFAKTLNTEHTFWERDGDPLSGITSDSNVDYCLAFKSLRRTYLDRPTMDHTEPVKVSQARILEDIAFDREVRRFRAAYLISIDYFARYRRLATTVNSDIALVPTFVEPGGLICVVPGGRVPFIIRQFERQDSAYRVVGEAYVADLMHGQGRHKNAELQDIRLV